MPVSPNAMKLLLLIPLAVTVTYFDMRYRRIPNVLVLAALVSGLVLNASLAGVQGTISSVAGFGLAFIPMFLMHIFGAMGAGDVKLFGAVGAVLGVGLVPMTFVVVVMLGHSLSIRCSEVERSFPHCMAWYGSLSAFCPGGKCLVLQCHQTAVTQFLTV